MRHLWCNYRLLILHGEIQIISLEWIIQNANNIWERLLVKVLHLDRRPIVRGVRCLPLLERLPLHIQRFHGDSLGRRIHQIIDLAVDVKLFVFGNTELPRQLREPLIVLIIAVRQMVSPIFAHHHVAVRRCLQLVHAPADIAHFGFAKLMLGITCLLLWLEIRIIWLWTLIIPVIILFSDSGRVSIRTRLP